MAEKIKKKKFKIPRINLGRLTQLLTPRGSRFVLYLGDEGAILVHVKDRVVKHRQFVPDSGAQNLEELRATLADDPRAPVMMVVDTMDQSYIQQTLPPVSPFSVKKLIKRRLDRDFGANDIKGAVMLGREEGGRKDWNFLMVAFERTPAIAAWLDFLTALPNHFQGIYLVSVEAENIVKDLEQAMGAPKEGTGSEWKFFVSHNKVGGFRQVILRNNRIIFTRLAQPIPDSKPEVMAGSIEQEMLSTIEYMRRLAYNPQAGLDIYIVAGNAIKSAIDKAKFNADVVHLLTPYELAQNLKIEGATQPNDQFGDVVLAASIGASRQHVLTLSTPKIKAGDQLFKWHLYQRLAAAAAAIMILLYIVSSCFDIYTSYSGMEELRQKKRGQQQILADLRNEIKKSNLDVEKTMDLIDLYKQIQEERTVPLKDLAKLEGLIKPPVQATNLEWLLPDIHPGSGGTVVNPQGPTKMQINMVVQFIGINRAEFKKASKQFLADLKTAFKGSEVSYTRLPPGFSENERVEMTLNDNDSANAASTTFSDIALTIKGDTSPTGDATPPPAKAP